MYGLNQWEIVLQCNAISQWLCPHKSINDKARQTSLNHITFVVTLNRSSDIKKKTFTWFLIHGYIGVDDFSLGYKYYMYVMSIPDSTHKGHWIYHILYNVLLMILRRLYLIKSYKYASKYFKDAVCYSLQAAKCYSPTKKPESIFLKSI